MTQQLSDAGVYTPTLTNTTNVSASTAEECMWFRVGNLVHVAGRLEVDPTAAAPTDTALGISLPIPSDFGNTRECCGVCATGATVTQSGSITGDATNKRATMLFSATSTANLGMRFEFTYRLI